MTSELVRELIESGVHFGHRTSRWNPKMQPYIFGKRNLIHIIDIRETVRGLLLARRFISSVVAKGQDLLFVGTKRQAREAIRKQSQRCGMPYVTERWLGGTLTNFRTIRSRLARLEELEAKEASGEINNYSKKMISTLQRERRRIQRNLEGIRTMTRLPGVLFLVDVRHEHIAIKEAKKLGIPTICLVDTDGDPTVADIVIPGNDDALRAINLVVQHMADAVEEGKRSRASQPQPAAPQDGSTESGAEAGDRFPRRSRRMSASRTDQQSSTETPGGRTAHTSPEPARARDEGIPSPPQGSPGAAESVAGATR